MIRLQVLKLVFGRTEPDGQNRTDGRTEPRTDGWTDVEVEIVIEKGILIEFSI